MILFIKNISIEGPGTLGCFFEKQGLAVKTTDLSLGGSLPDTLDGIQAVVCLGGPMNVYEEDKYPFLKDEDAFIKKILKEEIPFLGLCLGAQLLAKACGAKVVRSPRKEIGFVDAGLTSQGEQDPLFSGVNNLLNVFQWHEDMFEIPKGGRLLAMSDDCPHQAFGIGKQAYGLQFHLEITDQEISEWSQAYFRKGHAKDAEHKEQMLRDYRMKKEKFNKPADQVYNNFFLMIKNKGTTCSASR